MPRDFQTAMRTTLHSQKYEIYRKEKEIMSVRHKKNVSFPESKEIVKSYMGTESYVSGAQKTNQTNQIEIIQEHKYLEPIEKLLHLNANKWSNF